VGFAAISVPSGSPVVHRAIGVTGDGDPVAVDLAMVLEALGDEVLDVVLTAS
jgi:hypothetical protein